MVPLVGVLFASLFTNTVSFSFVATTDFGSELVSIDLRGVSVVVSVDFSTLLGSAIISHAIS